MGRDRRHRARDGRERETSDERLDERFDERFDGDAPRGFEGSFRAAERASRGGFGVDEAVASGADEEDGRARGGRVGDGGLIDERAALGEELDARGVDVEEAGAEGTGREGRRGVVRNEEVVLLAAVADASRGGGGGARRVLGNELAQLLAARGTRLLGLGRAGYRVGQRRAVGVGKPDGV